MDLDEIKALLKLMKENDVTALEWEGDGRRIHLSLASAAPARAPAYAPQAAAAPAGAPAAPAAPGHVMLSPMVGTFYESSKPGAPPFVTVGARVRKGQPLCIIEAMKLMNELECEHDGTVAEILVQNAQPVQFGQPLYRIIAG